MGYVEQLLAYFTILSALTCDIRSSLQEVVVPILAQRLLINMRSIDYMGSHPLASTLLFARTQGGSDDLSEEGDTACRMAELSSTAPSIGKDGGEKEIRKQQLSAA